MLASMDHYIVSHICKSPQICLFYEAMIITCMQKPPQIPTCSTDTQFLICSPIHRKLKKYNNFYIFLCRYTTIYDTKYNGLIALCNSCITNFLSLQGKYQKPIHSSYTFQCSRYFYDIFSTL